VFAAVDIKVAKERRRAVISLVGVHALAC